MRLSGLAMKKARFSSAHKDEALLALAHDTDQKTLAIWAIACAEGVPLFFEHQFRNFYQTKGTRRLVRFWYAG